MVFVPIAFALAGHAVYMQVPSPELRTLTLPEQVFVHRAEVMILVKGDLFVLPLADGKANCAKLRRYSLSFNNGSVQPAVFRVTKEGLWGADSTIIGFIPWRDLDLYEIDAKSSKRLLDVHGQWKKRYPQSEYLFDAHSWGLAWSAHLFVEDQDLARKGKPTKSRKFAFLPTDSHSIFEFVSRKSGDVEIRSTKRAWNERTEEWDWFSTEDPIETIQLDLRGDFYVNQKRKIITSWMTRALFT